MAGATTGCTGTAFKATSTPPIPCPSLTAKIQGKRREKENCLRRRVRERGVKEVERERSQPPTMPPWAAPSLVLVLLLLLQGGRGGHSSGLRMEMEMEMDSETHGRLLWEAATGGRRYISYDALRGDAVPCSRPGVPYYNCRMTITANPYTRGCESITKCRDVEDPR